MNNKIETFLQEIHSLSDESLDKVQLEKDLNTLISASPDISADPEFKAKLKTRLNNIIEFKAGNSHAKKIGYLKILFPIFACFVLIVGVFSMIDINFFQGEDRSVVPIQDENPLPPTGASLLQEEENSDTLPESTAQLSMKERILAKKAAEQAAQDQQAVVSEAETPPKSQALPALAETQDEDTSGTQLKGSPPANDTPDAQFADGSSEESAPNEDLMMDVSTSSNSSFSEEESENYDGFELFCKDNLGTILETEEERVCDLGEGKICTEMEVNTETCEIE